MADEKTEQAQEKTDQQVVIPPTAVSSSLSTNAEYFHPAGMSHKQPDKK